MAERNDLINAAIEMRTARAFNDRMDQMGKVHRLQIEDQLADAIALRDEIKQQMDQQDGNIAELLRRVMDVMERFESFIETPPKTVEANVKLEQQPVNVNLPEMSVSVPVPRVEPVINTPSASVIVEPCEMPKKAIIKHSDGTQSTIEFK